jgi:hypothetical protein
MRYLKTLESEIKHNIKTFTLEQIFQEYGISILSDESIYDDVSNRTYPNLNEWLFDYLDDSREDVEMIGKDGYFDDY